MLHDPLMTIAAAVILGIIGQCFANLARLPAIIFLLLLGILAGPYGLHLVDPDDLGSGLPVIVSAFLAVILFEGAITLRPPLIRQALIPVRRLITVGAILTLLGAAILGHFLVALPWPLAFLFASLVVVTGPTVIAPILRRVRLKPQLHAVIKSESILIDPVGVFAAVVIFQYVVDIVTRDVTWVEGVWGFTARVGIGASVGVCTGLLAAALAQLRFFRRPDAEYLINLGALGLALGAFAVSERLQSQSGIMAVICAGLVVATMPIPFREELEKFKEQVTILGVSVLFILLAANLNLHLLLQVGWREVALLAGLIFLVRPTSVFISTIGTALNWREKSYLSMIAPRGILAAAMASYFAEQLRNRGLAGANRIEKLVFLTIAVTVLLQGAWAALMARLLHVQFIDAEGVCLVGVNEWSLVLAKELRTRGWFVFFLDNNAINCDLADGQGFKVQQEDATERDTYKQLDLSSISMLIAMTGNDAVNTLACDAASNWLGRENVFQIISKPSGESPRTKVRMLGRWAMPTRYTHREILSLLARKLLRVEAIPCPAATVMAAETSDCAPSRVPLVVLDGNRLSLAVDGSKYRAGAIILTLVPVCPNANPSGNI
jgi:NhaP-type Na+/H+ or K+/H+ antiporter